MPRLGEAIEPAQVESVSPWWRDADAVPDEGKRSTQDEAPETVSPAVGFPID